MNDGMSIVLDNNKDAAIGEYIKDNTISGSIFTVVSSIFTIYAFYELRKVLEKSVKFSLLFNETTFIKKIIYNHMFIFLNKYISIGQNLLFYLERRK